MYLNEVNPNTTILIAFSAGPDSVYLLHKLSTLTPKPKLVLMYCNHNLRPKEVTKEIQLTSYYATQYDYPIARSFKILDNHGLKMVAPENINKRSQDLAPDFHDAGQFYWGTKESWVQDRPIFSEKSTIVDLPSYMVVDIDTDDDWVRAELMFKLLKEK